MDYATILDMPDWEAVGLSVVQSIVLYLLVLACLKMAGRRMFAEMGAQDFVVLLLVADASNLGLTHTDGGFWASVFSVVTIITLGSIIEHIPLLRHLVAGKPIVLYDKGRLEVAKMKHHKVEIDDLNETARAYGQETYKAFKRIVLESDGELTGVLPRGGPAKT
jgi:uncharacterized membrane protein YcaP (DUF421 family)